MILMLLNCLPDLHRLPHERGQAHPDDAAVPAALARPRGARLQRARVQHELRVHVVRRAVLRHRRLRLRAGTNCLKIGLPGKSILGDFFFEENRTFPKTFSLTENQFSRKTYFYTIASRFTLSRSSSTRRAGRWRAPRPPSERE